MLKKKSPLHAHCSRGIMEEYSTIIPNQYLEPIGGKFIWNIDESSLTKDMDKYKTIYAFEQAFKKWEELIAPIKFQATGNIKEAQIVIRFKNNGDANLPYQFADGVLAYAFAPTGKSLGMQADMYLNDAYQWDEIHKIGSIYLFKVVVHEISHILNMSHQTSDNKDILFPVYQPNGEVMMNNDTRQGIADIYGKFGVAFRPIGGNSVGINSEAKALLKSIFKTTSDLNRLSVGQITTLSSYLGLSITSKLSHSKKCDMILALIKTF